MALVKGWLATIMSKFSQNDGVPDTLHDTIGTLGRAICAQPYFNAEAFRLKAELIKCLSAQRYTSFTANVTNYGSRGVAAFDIGRNAKNCRDFIYRLLNYR